MIKQKLFLPSYRYLDQFGMSSMHNTKVYCRQTLVGGFYGLLEKETFVPNPDYYKQVNNQHKLLNLTQIKHFLSLSGQCASLAPFDG